MLKVYNSLIKGIWEDQYGKKASLFLLCLMSGEGLMRIDSKKLTSVLFIFLLFASCFTIFQNHVLPVQATVSSTSLYVNGFASTWEQWQEIGVSPWLNVQDQPTNYLNSTAGSQLHGNFTFADLPSTVLSIINVTLYVYGQGAGLFKTRVYMDKGAGWTLKFDAILPASWAWATVDVSSFLTTVAEVNSVVAYLDAYTGGAYGQKVDAMYLLVYYNTHGSPSASMIGVTGNRTSGVSATFYANWTFDGGYTGSYFTLHWNYGGGWIMPNGTLPFSGVTWSNVTQTLPSLAGGGVGTMQWYIDCNDTYGAVGNMSVQTLWLKPVMPTFLESDLGFDIFSLTSVYVNGTVEAQYVGLQNTSFSVWASQIKAFNMKTQEWTQPFTVRQFGGENDGHYFPSIALLPNGSLILSVAYINQVNYRISKNSALTETNLTKICSEWNDWTNITITIGNSFSYPTFYFDSANNPTKLVLFARSGVAANGNLTKFKWNTGTNSFDNPTTVIYMNSTDIYYFYPNLVLGLNNEILLTWLRKTTSDYGGTIYYMYSKDGGDTWWTVDGNAVYPPIYFEYSRCAVVSDNYVLHFWDTAYIDQNNVTKIMYCVAPKFRNYWYPNYYKIAVYNYPYWTIYNVTNFNGATIENCSLASYHEAYDKYYKTASFWMIENNTINKYVAYTDSAFDVAYSISANNSCFELGGGDFIERAPSVYEVFLGVDTKLLGLGERNGDSQTSMNATLGCAYATAFTASDNGVISGGRVKLNSSTTNTPVTTKYGMAIYNSTYNLIAYGGTWNLADISVDNWTGWSTYVESFTVNAPVVKGQTYYVAIILTSTNSSLFYFSGTENQSFRTADTGGSFPATLVRVENFSCAFLMSGFQVQYSLNGKPDVFYTQILTNGTFKMGETVTFNVHWYCQPFPGRTLSTALFYWNMSGAMLLNDSSSLNGTSDWGNFTKTFPFLNASYSITWQMTANDTEGHFGSTPTQYLTMLLYLNISISDITTIQASMSITKTVFSNPTETTTVTSQNGVVKSIFTTKTDVAQPQAALYNSKTVTSTMLETIIADMVQPTAVLQITKTVATTITVTITEILKPSAVLQVTLSINETDNKTKATGYYVLNVYVSINGLPASNANVSIGGQSKITNVFGKTSFTISYGTYELTVQVGKNIERMTVLINEPKIIPFAFSIEPSKTDYLFYFKVLALIVCINMLFFIGVTVKKSKKKIRF